MITLTLSRKKYQVPTRWSEMTTERGSEFVALCSALADFEAGRDDFSRLRVRSCCALLGLDMTRVGEITPEFEENMFRISELVNFPWRLESKEGETLVWVDITLDRNLLPEIGGVTGYRFSISAGGMVDCSLTAEQYIDSVQLVQVYSRTFSPEALAKLAEVLYPGASATEEEQLAVYYNFRGILDWIKRLPDYALIFRTSSERSSSAPASPLGMTAPVFQMARAGYGSIEDIKRLDLFSYLGLLVQMTVDSILAYKAQKLKPVEVAERLNLDVDLVAPYFAS